MANQFADLSDQLYLFRPFDENKRENTRLVLKKHFEEGRFSVHRPLPAIANFDLCG